MDSFQVRTVLIYNPTLRSANRKALEEEIQDTKILFYSPKSSEIEEKRFHVGMAEGTYCFFDSMLGEDEVSPGYQIIHTKSQIYINKEVEENIWMFLGLRKSCQKTYSNQNDQYLSQEVHRYDDEIFSDVICLKIVNHLYQNFRVFNGEITPLTKDKERLEDLDRVMTQFLSRYIYLNENKNRKKLQISFYQFEGVRMIPLDHNYSLKFNYFHSTSKNFDPSIEQTMLFYNGYLVYSSLPPETTIFFYNYYYSLGQPFQFDQWKLMNKFSHLQSHNQLSLCKYGYFINSHKYGYQKKSSKKENETNIDLLGLDNEETINGIPIYLLVDNSSRQYFLNTYHSNKLLQISLCSKPRSIQNVQLHNKLIKDNIDRFCNKLNTVVIPLSNQQQLYRFLYLNLATQGGKMTFTLEDGELHNSIKYMLEQMSKRREVAILHTTSKQSLYGVRRLSRIVILILGQQIPIHKIEEYFDRLCKEYFGSVYM